MSNAVLMGAETPAQLMEQPLEALSTALDSQTVSARELVDECLARIEDPAGEGTRSFLSVASERARSEADEIDGRRKSGQSVLPLAGIPIALKDLFDVEGEVTTAGSIVLKDNEPATADAPSVARLRSAGLIVLGRTNMTEFAYSGLGLNPHFDTPRSVWRRNEGHIPGGSSSGSAVAVADGQAGAALGTDTGGSCRIPAAFSNIVGYKPTASLVPLDGVVPLAKSLDSVGPLATSVTGCRTLHHLLVGQDAPSVASSMSDWTARNQMSPSGIRLAVLSDIVLDGLDKAVQERFEAALSSLNASGVDLVERRLPSLNDLGTVNANGGLAAAEAFQWHERLIGERGDQYDPLVRSRIEAGSAVTETDVAEVVRFRQHLIESFKANSDDVDAWVLPTVAILPPTVDQFEAGDDDYYRQANLMALRNTSIGNMLDSCAISIPLCQHSERTTAPPVGLMLMAPGLSDQQLFDVAGVLEPACRRLA